MTWDEIPWYQWAPLSQIANALPSKVMACGSDFVLRNWAFKYVDIRVDMRTGAAIAIPGNVYPGADPKLVDRVAKLERQVAEANSHAIAWQLIARNERRLREYLMHDLAEVRTTQREQEKLSE